MGFEILGMLINEFLHFGVVFLPIAGVERFCVGKRMLAYFVGLTIAGVDLFCQVKRTNACNIIVSLEMAGWS